MATRTLYLIRHGQHQRLELDAAQASLTWQQRAVLSDGGLTPTGEEQAKLTAQRLRSLSISAIFSSSLPRAAETAQIIARELPGLPLQRSRVLWECIPSVPPEFAAHFQNMPTELIVHGKQQAMNAFERYFKGARGEDKCEIVVSHGNLIRYLVCLVLRVRPDAWSNMSINNCGISNIVIDSQGKARLVSFNDVGHLPEDLKTQI